MTTYNTGNPLGSTDPRDLYDNAENLDHAVNSDEDTFQDRLGKSRLSWAGIVKAGSGDPAIAVDAAARAEAAASQVQQDADQIAADAAQQAVSGVVLAVDGAVDRAENAATRAETASNSAAVNADVKPDVATGLAETGSGEQFQVVEGADLVRYLNQAGNAVELARIVAESVIATNRRINAVPQRDRFVSGEVAGPFRALDGEQISVGDWEVNADGELVYAIGVEGAGSGRYYFDTGAYWDRTEKLTVALEATLAKDRNPGSPASRAPAIILRGPEGIYVITFAQNGTVAAFDPNNTAIWSQNFPELVYGYGDRVSMTLEIDTDGLMYIQVSTGGVTRSAELRLPESAMGEVVPGMYNLYSDITFHRFYVSTSPVTRRDLPEDAYQGLQKSNLVQSPGNTGTDGWSKSAPSATLEVTHSNGEPAFLISHTSAVNIYYDINRDESRSELAYSLTLYKKSWSGGRAFILQYQDDGVEIHSARTAIDFPLGDITTPQVFSGVVALDPEAADIRLQISSQGEGYARVGRVMMAYDDDTRYRSPSVLPRIEGLSLRVSALEQSLPDGGNGTPRKPLPYSIRVAALNHAIFYGQSNSIGATVAGGTTALSLSQPYHNVTFAGGPRAWDQASGAWSFLPLKPLVEDDDYTGGSGNASVPLGETQCSGSANYAVSLGAARGVMPNDLKILASTAGRGSYLINQLRKGSAWYPNFTDQIEAGKSADADYACHFVGWIQGERDADVGTSYEDYRSMLESLQADAELDIQGISGQSEPVPMLVSQVTAYARKNDMTARAQFDAAQYNDKIFVVTSSYRFPYGGNIHFTNVGAKLNGAYFGKAHDALLQGLEPESLRPVSATSSGLVVRVRFDVPHLPMRLDTVQLADTTDYGFQVRDAGGSIDIESIELQGWDVVITLASEPQGDSVVRYALDYAGEGRTVSGGQEGCGNLRDSAPDRVAIDGIEYQLFNVAPAFELPVVRLGF